MPLRLLLFVAVLLSAGCYDSSFGEPDAGSPPHPVSATISELRASYAGTTFLLTEEVTVTGVVTTSDSDQNFYRTLCIEQQGAGLEIMAGIDHLHNDFPVGCRVTIRLKGLALGQSRGVLQAGRMPAPGSGYATDYIGSPVAVGAALMRNSEELQPVQPTLRTLGELTPLMCGTLIRIDRLRYTPEELTPGTWSGYKPFTDNTGLRIDTYVRPYADFATEELPAGECSLTGILQYDGSRYQLKPRDASDCIY